jgi:acyl carrier protein
MARSPVQLQTTDIEAEVRAFLVDNFVMAGCDELRDEARLLGNIIDSNGVLELVMFLQDRFVITVEDDEVTTENLDSVRNVVHFVEKKLKSRA